MAKNQTVPPMALILPIMIPAVLAALYFERVIEDLQAQFLDAFSFKRSTVPKPM